MKFVFIQSFCMHHYVRFSQIRSKFTLEIQKSMKHCINSVSLKFTSFALHKSTIMCCINFSFTFSYPRYLTYRILNLMNVTNLYQLYVPLQYKISSSYARASYKLYTIKHLKRKTFTVFMDFTNCKNFPQSFLA